MDEDETELLAAELVEALASATEAASARDRAVDQCESSADYFCRGEYERADLAAKTVASVIVRLIDERVKIALSRP